jgi:hypothetical protein
MKMAMDRIYHYPCSALIKINICIIKFMSHFLTYYPVVFCVFKSLSIDWTYYLLLYPTILHPEE